MFYLSFNKISSKKCFSLYEMSYYQNNREKILDKYHNHGGKEKAKEYYQNNKDILKEKARVRYQTLSEEQKEIKRQYSRNRYQE